MKFILFIFLFLFFSLKYNIIYSQGNIFNTFTKYGKKETITFTKEEISKNSIKLRRSVAELPTQPSDRKETIEMEVSSDSKLIKEAENLRIIKNNKFTFRPPLRQLKVTSGFGNRIHPVHGRLKFHAGVDYKAYYEPVYVIADGVVTFAGRGKNEGNYVVVQHSENSKSIYCHLSSFYVAEGQRIPVGHIIGKSGNTGRSTGPHLHFAVKYNGKYLNPSYLFN